MHRFIHGFVLRSKGDGVATFQHLATSKPLAIAAPEEQMLHLHVGETYSLRVGVENFVDERIAKAHAAR
jgi:hypothetical protein